MSSDKINSMKVEQENNNLKQKIASDKGKVHFVLSHSYLVFLFAVVFGVIFDMIIPLKFFSNNIFQYFGLTFIIIGTAIVYWAQTSSNILKNKRDKEKLDLGFAYGPYKYSRSPTHLGLFIMTFGLALIINSTFTMLFTILAYILTKLIYLKREEKLLEKKYGEEYCNYKNKTKSIL